MTAMVRIAGAALLLGLAGCATQQPFSYIDGRPYHKTEMNSYPVLVLDVDNKSYVRNPVMIDPGQRSIRVQGPPAPGFIYGETRTFTLDVQPCMHYYLKAVKQNAIQQDFEPMVDYVERISGCG